MKLSLVIPVKDKNDIRLAELIRSIEAQDFDKSEMEVLLITEGTSESAKAIGIKKAKGEVIGILASDNELIYPETLKFAYKDTLEFGSASPSHYYYNKNDNILNRYFSLIGGNDVLSYYMGKNDRSSYIDFRFNSEGSIGDNGYFIKKVDIKKTDLDNYYHIDNAIESGCFLKPITFLIWHKTGGNIFKFFAKRYHYGLQHAFNKNRRWHLVDFSKPKDIWRLIWFVLSALTLIQPLSLSFRGWMKIKDVAWFIHPVACLLCVVTYTTLLIHLGARRIYQSLFAPMVAQKA